MCLYKLIDWKRTNQVSIVGQFKCDLCSVTKFSLKDLKQHCFIEHKYCFECKIKFESHTSAREHTRDSHKMKINVKLCKMHLLKHETFRTLVLVILIGADLTQSHSCFIATSSKLNFNSEDISWDDNFLFLSFHEKKIICNLWLFFFCVQFFVCLQF